MVSGVRLRIATQGSASLAGQLSVSAFLFLLSAGTASGSVQQNALEAVASLPPSRSIPASGEIEYAFDTALNKTRARLSTSLASQNFLSRIFSGSTVHTLVAVYEFGGRAPASPPDSIRLSFRSDEYTAVSPGYRPSLGAEPVLVITFGDSVVRLPVGIAQRIEVWSPPRFVSGNVGSPLGRDPGINWDNSALQVHIERTATVRLSSCDFLALLKGKDVRGTVAGLDFEVSKEVVSRLREFASGMTPSAAPLDSLRCGSR